MCNVSHTETVALKGCERGLHRVCRTERTIGAKRLSASLHRIWRAADPPYVRVNPRPWPQRAPGAQAGGPIPSWTRTNCRNHTAQTAKSLILLNVSLYIMRVIGRCVHFYAIASNLEREGEGRGWGRGAVWLRALIPRRGRSVHSAPEKY